MFLATRLPTIRPVSRRHTLAPGTLLAALVMVTAVCGAPALASDAESRKVTVATVDLDLATAAGVRTLYQRIRHAAREVCDPANLHLYTQVARVRGAACYRSTIEHFVVTADLPQLTALHRGATDRPTG